MTKPKTIEEIIQLHSLSQVYIAKYKARDTHKVFRDIKDLERIILAHIESVAKSMMYTPITLGKMSKYTQGHNQALTDLLTKLKGI